MASGGAMPMPAQAMAAVAAGRSIYANTKQFIRYMVSSNIGALLGLLVSPAWLRLSADQL